jgi:hypothetical protein
MSTGKNEEYKRPDLVSWEEFIRISGGQEPPLVISSSPRVPKHVPIEHEEPAPILLERPKGRGRGYQTHICVQDDLGVEWEWDFQIVHDIYKLVIELDEKEIELNWRSLLYGKTGTRPIAWEEGWLSEGYVSILSKFPGIRCKVGYRDGMCSGYWYDYYLYESHFDWMLSCFETVLYELEQLLKRNDKDAK